MPVLNAGVAEEVHVEHRLVDAQLPRDEQRRARRPRSANAPSVAGAPPPLRRAPRSGRRRATRSRRSTAPRRAGRACPARGPSTSGTRNHPATSASDDDRHVHEEHRAVPEVAEQQAARRPVRSRPPRRSSRPRSRSPSTVRSAGKTLTRIDNVDGMISAADAPITRAARDELPHLGRLPTPARHRRGSRRARAAARPCARSGRRARRSRRAGRRTRASTTATTHCSCDVVACRSRESVGIATFRLELPTKTMSRLRQSTAERPPAPRECGLGCGGLVGLELGSTVAAVRDTS